MQQSNKFLKQSADYSHWHVTFCNLANALIQTDCVPNLITGQSLWSYLRLSALIKSTMVIL